MQLPILFVGDIHTKKKLFAALEQLLKVDLPMIAELYNVRTIVFLGDLFNQVSRLDCETLLCCYDNFYELAQHYEVHILAGNHDQLYAGDNHTNVLRLYSEIVQVHTTHTLSVSDGFAFEWLPWTTHGMEGDHISIFEQDIPGMLITHRALRSVVDALRIEKFLCGEAVVANPDPSRIKIISGHIHAPFDAPAAGEWTVGVPYPTRDKAEEYNNRLLLFHDKTQPPLSIPLANGVLYTTEIANPEQLPPLREYLLEWFAAQNRPNMKMRIELICFTGAIKSRDIAAFKKDTNWSVRLDDRMQQQASTAQQASIVAAHKTAQSPLAVYSKYLQAHPVESHTAQELLEILTTYGGVK